MWRREEDARNVERDVAMSNESDVTRAGGDGCNVGKGGGVTGVPVNNVEGRDTKGRPGKERVLFGVRCTGGKGEVGIVLAKGVKGKWEGVRGRVG